MDHFCRSDSEILQYDYCLYLKKYAFVRPPKSEDYQSLNHYLLHSFHDNSQFIANMFSFFKPTTTTTEIKVPG